MKIKMGMKKVIKARKKLKQILGVNQVSGRDRNGKETSFLSTVCINQKIIALSPPDLKIPNNLAPNYFFKLTRSPGNAQIIHIFMAAIE